MLRVLLSRATQPDRADPWVRHAADGRAVAFGRDIPARWPDDAEVEVVLAAEQVRLLTLSMPPMSHDRLYAAVRFALEDKLATPIDEASIALSGGTGGAVLAAVASAALVDAIHASYRNVRRIVPESALAPHDSGWTWCVSAAGEGFVRRFDGSAFGVGTAETGSGMPVALDAALGQAVQAAALPSVVNVAFPCSASQLASWSESGVRFVEIAAWHWERTTSAVFASAPDFLANGPRERAPPSTAMSKRLRPALVLAALAAVLAVGGLALQWTILTFENWHVSRQTVEAAAIAQLSGITTPAEAVSAIARRNAEVRHAAGQTAPADALPLLARAAPALGALPPRSLRSARYDADVWTVETGKIPQAALSRMTRDLAAAGVDALAAPTAAGMRVRMSLAPTAR